MTTPRTVALHTLGCKLNYAETSSVRRLFENDGYAVVPFNDQADVYVLNTCSVTENADRECRKIVRQVRRLNHHAKIVVMGCYAQLKPQEIAGIEGVDLVLGAAEKFNVMDFLHALNSMPEVKMHAGEVSMANIFQPAYSIGDRTRSFLKVQDGCNYKCTFCTIPKARGSSRSARIDDIVDQAAIIGQQGVREIVLTGVNIGDFGNGTEVIEGVRTKKESLFIDLIRALDHVNDISRFRISSIEPNLCTNEIIEFVAYSKKFMPHFHMPLQSGNNEMLGNMRRRYLRELYEDRVRAIRLTMPHACIGVDVISGFPGESEDHFRDSYNFLQNLEIDYIHAFTYSERSGTPAAMMPGKIDIHTRRRRSHQLRQLSSVKKSAHYHRHRGEIREVLVENDQTGKYLGGFTDNYIRVRLKNHGISVNDITAVELQSVADTGDELLMDAIPSTIHAAINT